MCVAGGRRVGGRMHDDPRGKGEMAGATVGEHSYWPRNGNTIICKVVYRKVNSEYMTTGITWIWCLTQ